MYSFLVLSCLLLCLHSSIALYIDLNPGDMRCVGQELDQLERVVFALSGSSKIKDLSQRLNAKINNPDDEGIFFEKIPINSKVREFVYEVKERGVYEICFELHEGKTPVRAFFHVDYRPLTDGQDLSHHVNKQEVTTLKSDLDNIIAKLKAINSEVDHAKSQEAALIEANEKTSNLVGWFSYLSMGILLAMSAWQIFYLRSFFTTKKLL